VFSWFFQPFNFGPSLREVILIRSSCLFHWDMAPHPFFPRRFPSLLCDHSPLAFSCILSGLEMKSKRLQISSIGLPRTNRLLSFCASSCLTSCFCIRCVFSFLPSSDLIHIFSSLADVIAFAVGYLAASFCHIPKPSCKRFCGLLFPLQLPFLTILSLCLYVDSY